MKTARKILDFTRPGTAIEFSPGSEKEIGLSRLINKLNFVNFLEDSILVNFRHPRYPRTISLGATPLPCATNKLEVRWTVPDEYHRAIASCIFEDLFIIGGQKLVIAAAELVSVDEEGAVFLLPERSIEVNYGKTRRHACEGVEVELLQNSARFKGKLLDFSAESFRMETDGAPGQSLHWINQDAPVHAILSKHATTIYSGMCRITSQGLGQRKRGYDLEPLESNMQRFKPKEIRSVRREIRPLPSALFTHPLSGKRMDLKVIDISGSGCSVHEEVELSVLFTGMIIPELELRIASGVAVTCVAQVVHRSVQQPNDESRYVKCGLAFLDMDARLHADLLSLLSLAGDTQPCVSNRANSDELWHFFFENGFIAPEKYASVQGDKNRLKEMYQRLYTQTPGIARHFIHRKQTILGHTAMLRFYEKSWLIHHHASNRSHSAKASLVLLNRLAHSINDCYNLRSARMDYALCYYQPEDTFANRILGTGTKLINDGNGCSTDTFAYLRYRREYSDDWNFSGPWALTRSTADDLRELEGFYEQESGGLMLHALDLEPEMADSEELAREYEEQGFTLKRRCYTLKKDGIVKAIFAVSISDVGVNLSDLTNCIKVMVADPEQFPKDIVFLTLSILAHKYRQNDLPVLVYPVSYAETAGMEYEKKYSLWCLNIPHSGPLFLKHLTGLMTRKRSGKALYCAAAC